MDASLHQLANEVGQLLEKNQLKLASAESCTGGGIGFYATSIPGSSNWYERGFVTYSNEAKQEALGVKKSTLDQFGAVSEETAIEMAKGSIVNSHATIAISTTGIAGPGGGSDDKPVGLVWLALANKDRIITQQLNLTGDRQSIREQSITAAFQLIRQTI